ncbi:hypothetical protein HDU85_003768 [Gaertneriomyces sp. JEL0708]|nr:hypothetical protein HDU85_003768 [Gaertneriomyces sp. JEL0708]
MEASHADVGVGGGGIEGFENDVGITPKPSFSADVTPTATVQSFPDHNTSTRTTANGEHHHSPLKSLHQHLAVTTENSLRLRPLTSAFSSPPAVLPSDSAADEPAPATSLPQDDEYSFWAPERDQQSTVLPPPASSSTVPPPAISSAPMTISTTTDSSALPASERTHPHSTAPYTVPQPAASSTASSAEASPWFRPTNQLYPLTSLGRNDTYTLQLLPHIDRGFFLADTDWTCYRRNYFSLSVRFTCMDADGKTVEMPCCVNVNGEYRTVTRWLVGVRARSSNAGRAVDIVQHTAKRDKGPQYPPSMKIIEASPSQPHQPGSDANSRTSPVGSDQTETSLATHSEAALRASPAIAPDTFSVHYDRLQFKSATANNGKRRAAQQYHLLVVELYAQTGDGVLVCVAVSESAPLVVRGRAPGHYRAMAERYGNGNTNGANQQGQGEESGESGSDVGREDHGRQTSGAHGGGSRNDGTMRNRTRTWDVETGSSSGGPSPTLLPTQQPPPLPQPHAQRAISVAPPQSVRVLPPPFPTHAQPYLQPPPQPSPMFPYHHTDPPQQQQHYSHTQYPQPQPPYQHQHQHQQTQRLPHMPYPAYPKPVDHDTPNNNSLTPQLLPHLQQPQRGRTQQSFPSPLVSFQQSPYQQHPHLPQHPMYQSNMPPLPSLPLPPLHQDVGPAYYGFPYGGNHMDSMSHYNGGHHSNGRSAMSMMPTVPTMSDPVSDGALAPIVGPTSYFPEGSEMAKAEGR